MGLTRGRNFFFSWKSIPINNVLLVCQTDFSLFRVAVICAILDRILFLKILSETTVQVFNTCHNPLLLSFYLDLIWMFKFIHNLGLGLGLAQMPNALFSALSLLYIVHVLSRLSTGASICKGVPLHQKHQCH